MSTNHTISSLIGRAFNGYRVTRYIARGGMGMVFEGVQESLNRPVALKFLYPHLSGDDRFRDRFEREARSIARLNHPNIVRVLDFGVEDTYYYMVLEYIDGPSLRDQLEGLQAQGLTLRVDHVINILQQVSDALTYAHGLGFVHRDVKPGNIMLGKDGRVYLTDFGVVKLLGSEQFTVTGAFLGTPEYMAPEQATSTEVSPATDLYSLAIVAYELLVGRVPFKASTPLLVMQHQLSDPPPPPSTHLPSLGDEVDAVFDRALAKQPSARYRSTREFVDDLKRVLATNPITGRVSVPAMVSDATVLHRPEAPTTPAGTTSGPYATPSQTSSGYGQPPVTPSYGMAPPASSGGGQEYPTGGVPPGSTPPPGATTTGAFPPERRRGATIAGAVLALLLIGALASYFLFMREDDDDTDTVAAGGPESTETTTAAAPTDVAATATSAPIAETPTVGAGVEATPTEVPAPATATATPLPPMVIYYAYKKQDEHNPQIYVMNLDGTNSHLFAEARGHSWAPVVSPDGTRLFFSSVTREGHTIHTADGGGLVGSGDHDIYVVSVAGTDQASLVADDLRNVTDSFTSWDNGWSWTVDGEWITMASDRPADDGTTDWEIYVMRPDGSEVRQITNNASDINDGWPVWTPDGKQIVYTSNATGDDEIWIMNADGTDQRQLTFREGTDDLYPSVSPDGTRIVFSSQIPDGNEGTIFIMDIDGGNLDQLTSTAALNNIPNWCPAGDLIVYVSDVRGNDNIYIMNADGTGNKPLTHPPDVLGEDPPENTTPFCSFLPGASAASGSP